MRKILAILVVGIFVLSGLGAVAISERQTQLISEKIKISNPKITEKNEFISINIEESKTDLLREGKPVIPKINKLYTFPFGTKINDVTVTFGETYEKSIGKKIEPSPELKIVSTLYKSKEKIETVNYQDIDTYPEKKFSYRAGAGIQNGEHVVFLNVNIYPVQYHPNLDKITYNKEANLDISYTKPKEPVNFLDEYDFLILTPSEFTSELQPLVDYKNNDGMSTIMKTLDDIPNNGVDIQESIKYYIKDAIENWGIEYVMLVGSWVEHDDEEPQSRFAKFPMRKAYIPSGSYEDWFPSDLYYADIYNSEGQFSTWDDNGNGKYAEFRGFLSDADSMDLYPDVHLGRLPCTSKSEVSVIVDKIINYEEHNKMLNKIVQIGGDTFPGDSENINEGEFANEEVLLNLPGYNSIRLWASQSNGASELTKQNIANGFKGNVDFVDFSGHGSYASWATHAPADDKTWLPPKTTFSPYTGWLYLDYDLFMVNNEYKHPVVVFNACSCSKFTESEKCISWKSINGKYGGIASFGASGIGYGSGGRNETERVWGWMEVNIFKGIYNDKVLGDVWSNCLTEYTSSFIEDKPEVTDYKTVVEMTMFGDPTLAIEDGKDPKTKTVDITQINSVLERIIDKYPKIEWVFKILLKLF